MASSRRARVTFEYEAAEPDELSLQIDDIIEDIVDEDVGWARGDLNGKKGLFPVNFVDFIENNAELAKSAGKAVDTKDSIAGRKACVLFDYEAENADELSLVTGIEINVIREVEDGWWEGTVDGRKGVFPSNFVKLKPIDETPTKTKRQPEKQPPAEEPDQEMYENLLSTQELKEEKEKESVPDAAGPEPDEEDAVNKRASFIESKKMGGGMGFGNLINAGVLSGINLKKVGGKKEEPKEKKTPPPVVGPETLTPKKQQPTASHSLGSSMKRKAPPVPPSPQPQEAQAPAKRVLRAKVTYDYEQQNEDELELKVGDIITIVKKEVFDTPGWMEGELDGKTGLFPDNFVEILPEETDKPEKPEKMEEKSEKAVPPAPKQVEQRAPPPQPSEEKQDIPLPSKPTAGARDMKKVLPKELKKPAPPPENSKPTIDAPKPSIPPKKPVPPKPSTKPQIHKKAVPIPPVDHRKESPKISMTEEKASESTPGVPDLDLVEPHETLTHLTANRVKNQQKRPPSRDLRNLVGDMVMGEDLLDTTEPEEPAWKREAREAREANYKKPEEKVAPSVQHLKDKKVLPVLRPEDILSGKSELRKSWREPDVPAPKKPVPPPPEDEHKKPSRPSPPLTKKTNAAGSQEELRKSSREEPPLKTKSVTTAGSSEELTALRAEVTELRSLCKELSDKFEALENKHAENIKRLESRWAKDIEQLTSDFDEERSNNARLKIEVDRLKKKMRRDSDAE
ncbi:SH3 domain-containing kinase-binding protein 1 [Nematostella vectensis]|uniref:SH3 domain-containing kinase-binding protein 1 n=1 Tax=Nematostella vectensis TaxID=45351 RepID=UPI0013906E3C|nr:SH3 domain-containing kinase-binding protein 1 [Nematostella vectensis]